MTTQLQEPNMVSCSVAALIDALRLSDITLCDRCTEALVAIGPRVVPTLNASLNEAKSIAHRRRILDAIELIEDTATLDQPGRDTGRAVWRALLNCLRVSNEQLNEKATEAISHFPQEIVHELVAKATYERRSRGYANRLMAAASRLGIRRPE